MNAIALLAASFMLAADEPNDDLKNLEGKWAIVIVEWDGKIHADKEVTELFGVKSIKIAGNKIDKLLGDRMVAFTIDAKTNPKHLDINRGKDFDIDKWIYCLDGDVLRLALRFDLKLFGGEPDRSRPESFTTKGNKVVSITLKREEK